VGCQCSFLCSDVGARTLSQEVLDLVRIEAAHRDMVVGSGRTSRRLAWTSRLAFGCPCIGGRRGGGLLSAVLGGGVCARGALSLAIALSWPPPAVGLVSAALRIYLFWSHIPVLSRAAHCRDSGGWVGEAGNSAVGEMDIN
jgi:hypothetical protein